MPDSLKFYLDIGKMHDFLRQTRTSEKTENFGLHHNAAELN